MLLALAEERGTDAACALAQVGVVINDVRAGILSVIGPCTDARRRPIDANALAALRIDLDEVRSRVEAAFGVGALDVAAMPTLPLAPRLKKALLKAYTESGALPAPPGSILMALATTECVAAHLLRQRGVTAAKLRESLN